MLRLKLAWLLFSLVSVVILSNARAVGPAAVNSKKSPEKTSSLVSRKLSKRTPSNDPKLDAQSLDSSLTTEQLRAAGYQVSGPIQTGEIATPEIRDSYFQRAGLAQAVASMDQFDKDILFMRASRYTPQRFVSVYARLPRGPLLQLQLLLQKR